MADWLAAVGTVAAVYTAVRMAGAARHQVVEPVLTVNMERLEGSYMEMAVANYGMGTALAVTVEVRPDKIHATREPQSLTVPRIDAPGTVFVGDQPLNILEGTEPRNSWSMRRPSEAEVTLGWPGKSVPTSGRITVHFKGRLGQKYRLKGRYQLVNGKPVCDWPV